MLLARARLLLQSLQQQQTLLLLLQCSCHSHATAGEKMLIMQPSYIN